MWEHFKRRVIFDKRGLFGFIKNLFGGGDKPQGRELKLPDFSVDPNIEKAQSDLLSIGKRLSSGDVPGFLSPLTSTGSKEFEDFLSLTNRDITKLVEESAARRGRARGGGVTEQLATSLAENTSKLRFADYTRALGGKESLFKTGLELLTGVRGAGLTNQAQKNQFALGRSNIEAGNIADLNKIAAETSISESEGIGSLIGAIPDIANIVGGLFKKRGGKGNEESSTPGTVSGNLGRISGTSGAILEDIFASL